jgi:ankyrin repeat protein
VVRCLLKDFGADVNQAMENGTTPLMVAAESGHSAVVQCLGVDVNLANHDY